MSPRERHEQKRTGEFTRLCQLHRTALSQASRAREAGHSSIAAGCLDQARGIQLQIAALAREDRQNELFTRRCTVSAKLHVALAGAGKDEAIQEFSSELASIDAQLEAV